MISAADHGDTSRKTDYDETLSKSFPVWQESPRKT